MPMRDVIRQQIEYYRARAGEYDEWFYRVGRYDRGPELNRRWFDEVQVVREALERIGPVEHALELACGTGIWTQELVRLAGQVTALDASPEVLAINQAKVASPAVDYRQVDLFAWEPERTYDLVFFSFWLSHVPPERLDPFLATVARAARPGGRLFLIDSRYEQTSTAIDNPLRDDEDTLRTRRLKDGREFVIVKVFYEPEPLRAKLAEHGFDADVRVTDHYFIYAAGTRR